ncbi:MAG: hypothetical protein IJL90_02950 [Lachnospiraceae bacterium]|nr:hypothetical protein [Lachnospiraceae bacterium]
MHADDRIIDYMKERNRYAATAACAAAVQLFALAVYLCIYALIAGGVFYSLSEKGGKIFAAAVCAVIAAGLVIFNICCVIKGKKVDITRPDSIAIRDSSEVVRLAYRTARPVLIYKITWWLVILAASPLVYIILVTAMDDQTLAPVYAKIIICIIAGFAVLFAYPCFDRIACYRALLNETHELYFDAHSFFAPRYILAAGTPTVICLWYLFRYYSERGDIAWIVLPLAVLLGSAISFLCGWTKQDLYRA